MSNDSPDLAIFLPSMSIGGSKRVMLQISRYFVEAGYDVEFVLAQKEGDFLNQIPQSTPVEYFGSRMAASLPNLVRYLHKKKPNTLISASDGANILNITAGKLANTQTQLVAHQGGIKWENDADELSRKKQYIRQLSRYTLPCADKVIAVSDAVKTNMLTNTSLNPEQIETIYNPVYSVDIPERAEEPISHDWFDDEIPILLGVGRLRPEKGFTTLIRAFKIFRQHTEGRLVILGTGPEREELERIIRELQLEESVVLLGFKDNPYKYMSQSDVFVLPSEREGFGNVIVEALGCGTPVVSTDCPGGPREILDDGAYGKLVPVGDAQALAEAIKKTIQQPPKSNKLRERAEEFGIDQIGPQYESVLFDK